MLTRGSVSGPVSQREATLYWSSRASSSREASLGLEVADRERLQSAMELREVRGVGGVSRHVGSDFLGVHWLLPWPLPTESE